jgi:hypothetical protein
VLSGPVSEYCCPITGLGGQAGRGFLVTQVVPLLMGGDREVLYLGDLDKCGEDIEASARRVLERECGPLAWERIGLTPEQTAGIEPIWKVDGRDRIGRWAWEVESLGQAAAVRLVQDALDTRLPEPLADVQEREQAQREQLADVLSDFRPDEGGSEEGTTA